MRTAEKNLCDEDNGCGHVHVLPRTFAVVNLLTGERHTNHGVKCAECQCVRMLPDEYVTGRKKS